MPTNKVPERVISPEVYEETGILYSDFTDGGGAAGTYTCQFTLPADFFIEQLIVKNVTGFAGNTSATLTVGDGSDVDRLNTGTPSVFATAAAVSMGVPSGTRVITTEFKPVLTVTGATDFTAINAGSMDVMVIGYQYD